MKILLIGPAYPLRGGIAQFLALLWQRLRDAGHDAVFHRFIRQYPEFLFPGKTQKEEGDPGLRAESLPFFHPYNPFNWPLAAYRIVRERPGLVIVKWWMPFFGPSYIAVLTLARIFHKFKILVVVDNAIPHEKRPGDMLITKIGFKMADYFVVMSEAVKEDLLKIKPNAKFVLTPHPLYDIFGEKLPKDKAKKALGLTGPVILFFGFVRAYKGLRVLLEAMPQITKKVPLTLLVAGEFYGDKEKYLQQIDLLGIGDSVRVLDQYIGNEEVGRYFSASDALVLPYLSATQSGITQIAFVFDLPVIATNVGGLPEVVREGETGYLVEPDDPHALAEAVIRYFTEGKETEFAGHIQEEKRRFSWEAFVEAVEELVRG
ncbi:MAG TPA: glycosyltransferase [Nitrospirota bacterium]